MSSHKGTHKSGKIVSLYKLRKKLHKELAGSYKPVNEFKKFYYESRKVIEDGVYRYSQRGGSG
jgi:hypothetical protein